HLRQRGEGHGQHADHYDPGGNHQPRCAHHEATERRKRIDAGRGPGGAGLVSHGEPVFRVVKRGAGAGLPARRGGALTGVYRAPVTGSGHRQPIVPVSEKSFSVLEISCCRSLFELPGWYASTETKTCSRALPESNASTPPARCMVALVMPG